ncbi:hypothetical protein ABZ705_20270 [Streptomyces sp. NPDC006984]|uniref:hypothetical protein n=1 Tax=Streptomyces sp. NPDC006984 TaxID=3155463 RepID=UPI0033FC614F
MSDGNYTPDYVFVFEPTLRAGAVQGVPAPLADGQASEITDLGAIPGTEGTTERPDLIPAAQVEPADVGALSLRYVGGVPQLVVSGGRAIPAVLAVVDESGVPVVPLGVV